MSNKKKKNRFSDLMAGDGPEAELAEGEPTFEEIAMDAAESESAESAAVKISFIARLKGAVQAWLENRAQKREERRKVREERILKEVESMAEPEKPAEFPAEIAMNAAVVEKKNTPAEESATELPAAEREQRRLAAGVWKMMAGTPTRKWVSISSAAACVLAVTGFFVANMFSGSDHSEEIAKNVPETQKSEAPAKPVKPAAAPVKEKSPISEKTTQKSSLNETFSAFSDPPPLEMPDFADDFPPPVENVRNPYDQPVAELSPEILPETGSFMDLPPVAPEPHAGLPAELPVMDDFPPTAPPLTHTGENALKPVSPAPAGGSLEEMEFIPLSSLPRATDILDNTEKKHTLAEMLADSPVVSAENILAPTDFAPENDVFLNNAPEMPPYPAKTAEDRSDYAMQPSRGSGANGGGISGDAAYVIRPGDDFTEISRKVYGTGSYARAIAVYNNMECPDNRASAGGLPAGKTLFIPQTAFLQKHYPSLCPAVGDSRAMLADNKPVAAVPAAKSEYVTRAGDNLPDIAQQTLGSASRWAEIYQLNREVLSEPFRAIQPGTRLRLPGEASAGGMMATRPEDGTGGRY